MLRYNTRVPALERAIKTCNSKREFLEATHGKQKDERGVEYKTWPQDAAIEHKELTEAIRQLNTMMNNAVKVRQSYSITEKGDAPGGRGDEFVERHASYAVIQVTKPQGSGGQHLFGSLIPHDRWVSLKICRAERHRNLNCDWVFPREEIIEVSLSNDQWSRVVANAMGEPTPVTLSYFEGEALQAPVQANRYDVHMTEFQSALNDAGVMLESGLTDCVDMLKATGTLKKADRVIIAKKIEAMQALFSQHGTLSYMSKCFLEFTQDMQQEFVQDAEAWLARVNELNSTRLLEHDDDAVL